MYLNWVSTQQISQVFYFFTDLFNNRYQQTFNKQIMPDILLMILHSDTYMPYVPAGQKNPGNLIA